MVELVSADDPGATNGEAPPRRGRGRPRGSTNANRDPNAPRRRRAGKPDLTKQIAEVLTLGNLALFGGELVPGMLLPGAIPAGLVLPGDPLADYEIDALAKAINGVAATNSVFYRYLNMLLTGTGGGSPYIALVVVCAAIAVPRVVAHGALPPIAATIAVGAGQYLGGMRPPENATLPTG